MKTLHQFDEVFDTQAVFRKVLEAMSNPTRTVSVAEQMENCSEIIVHFWHWE